MKIPFYFLFLFLSLTLSFFAYADTSSTSCDGDPNKIVAEVFGRKITEAELHQALSVDLYELQSNIFELKKRKIDELVGKIVLEKEAARRKMSTNELLEREVQRNTKKVSDKDIRKFYEQQKEHLKGTQEQYTDRIRNFLQNEAGINSYDLLTIPGAAKHLTAIGSATRREGLLEDIGISIRLHAPKEIILINHSDCGAYGGSAAFASNAAETEAHQSALAEAAAIINSQYLNITVKCYFARLDNGKIDIVKF